MTSVGRSELRHAQSVPVLSETGFEAAPISNSADHGVEIMRQASKVRAHSANLASPHLQDTSSTDWKRRTFTDGMDSEQLMQEEYLGKPSSGLRLKICQTN